MVGRQTDNNLKHYSLDQFLQQPQTSYKFTGMPTCDIYMEDVSLWHIIEVYNTFKLCLSSEKKGNFNFFFPVYASNLSCVEVFPDDVLLYFGNSNHMGSERLSLFTRDFHMFDHLLGPSM